MNPSIPDEPGGLIRTARSWAGRCRRAVRATVDGKLAPGRHRRALERLRALDRDTAVLFMCLGNVCRSPYAEARFLTLRAGVGRGSVSSAGFIGPGRPSPELGRKVALERGLDLEAHRSKQVTAELFDAAGLVIVMDASQERRLKARFSGRNTPILLLGDLDPLPHRSRTIRDPWSQDEATFAATFERIDRCLSVLWKTLARH